MSDETNQDTSEKKPAKVKAWKPKRFWPAGGYRSVHVGGHEFSTAGRLPRNQAEEAEWLAFAENPAFHLTTSNPHAHGIQERIAKLEAEIVELKAQLEE